MNESNPFAAALMAPHGNSMSSSSNKEHDWPNFFRLLAISGVATVATVGNIFTISSIIVNDLLRRKGNSFLVSLTLADLLITALVLPAACVGILAKVEESVSLCKFQYVLTTMSCVTASVLTAVVGMENLLRVRGLRYMEESRRQQRRRGQPVASAVSLGMHLVRASAPGPPPPVTQQPVPAPLMSLTNGSDSISSNRSVCSQRQVTALNLAFWVLSAIVVIVHLTFLPQLLQLLCSWSPSVKTATNSSNIANNATNVVSTFPVFTTSPNEEVALLHAMLVLGSFTLFFIVLGGIGFLFSMGIMRSWGNKPIPYATSREFALITSNFWIWLLRFLILCPSMIAAILTQLERTVSGESGGDESSSSGNLVMLPHGQHFNSSTILTSSTIPSNNSSIISNLVNSGDAASSILALQRLIYWPAIIPPCLSCVVYACANRDFRLCYIQFFTYCCCKTSVNLMHSSRDNPRGGGGGDHVRVHIIPGYNIYSSGGGGGAGGGTTSQSVGGRLASFKCGPMSMGGFGRGGGGGGGGGRDMYEL